MFKTFTILEHNDYGDGEGQKENYPSLELENSSYLLKKSA